MSIKTDSLYIDNFPALHAGLVGKDNWQIPVSGQWVPSITGEGATGTWNIDIDGNATSANVAEIADSLTLNSANSRTSYKLLLTDNTGKAYSDMNFQYVNSPIYGRSLSVNDITMKGSLLSEKEILIANNRVKIIGGELKADTLRQSLGLSNALHFIGVAINNITDGGTEDPGITNYQSKTAGDVVLGKDGHEYLWTGNAWEKLGDESSFKLKQSAVATPSSSATGCNAFISDISQNGEGIISPIKKQIAPLTLKNKFNQTLTYDGSSVITFSAAARRCIIGSETTEGLNKWYKFADITVPGRHPDREIVFKVSTGFHDNCKNQQSGILRAHIRCSGVAGKIERTQSNIQWEYANDTINPNNFILVYTDNTEKGEVLVELYVKLTEVYCHYHFNVLQEHDRRNTQTFWNLYSTNANGYENLPEDNQLSVGQDLDLTTLTYLPSVLLTIKNNVISLQNSTTSIADGKATFSGTTLIKGSFQSKNIYPYINSNESISNGNWNLGKKDAIWKGVYCKNLYFLDEENNGTDQESYAYITINSKGVAAAEGAEGAVGVAALKLGNSYPAEDILNADGTVKVAAKNGNAKGRIILYNTKNKCVHLEAPDGLKWNPTITFPLLSQTLIGTEGSSEIEGQLTPKATNTYDLGTSQLKWKNIYATTFNGNLVGIADEAKKVSNSLTINNRGKEITFNGEKSATLIVNRRCSVGRHGNASKYSFYTEDGKLKGWQKVASIIFQPPYADREIVFKVSRGMNPHKYSGILRAHLRINDTAATASKLITQLIWEYANVDVDLNKLMLIGTADTANNKIIGELWMNIGTASHDIYHFDVLQEHDRSVAGNVGYSDLWTLYNRDGSKEEDWQYFDLNEMSNKTLSVLATIKNNASTASSLSGTRTANTILAAPNGSNGTATFRKLVAADLPIASATEAGIITTGTQSLAGNKTFTGNLVMTKNGGMIKISSKDAYDGDGTTYSVALHVGNNLVSRGLYDVTNNKWIVYKDTEIDVVKTPSLFQAPRIILTNTTDAKLEKYDRVALTIGSSAAQHLEFDDNEILSKANASTAGILGLNMEGSVQLGKMILQSSNYGTLAPTDSNNTNTSSPVNGQIYFQLIE